MSIQDSFQLPLFEQEPAFSHAPSSFNKVDASFSKSTQESSYSKYIVYVDESGDHGLQNIDDSYPIFVLAFCVFHKRYYSEQVVATVEKFKFNHFGHDQVILHETDIRKEKKPFIFFGIGTKNRLF